MNKPLSWKKAYQELLHEKRTSLIVCPIYDDHKALLLLFFLFVPTGTVTLQDTITKT